MVWLMQASFMQIISGAVPSVLLRGRQLNNIKRAAFYRLGDYWHRKLRQKHFTVAGAREYGYTPRQGEAGTKGARDFWRSYTGRKLRTMGHRRPLVYTGESRDRSKAARIVAKATRSRTHVAVRMNVPGLNRRYAGSKINMAEELRTISAAEEVELRDRLEADIMGGFDRVRVRVSRQF